MCAVVYSQRDAQYSSWCTVCHFLTDRANLHIPFIPYWVYIGESWDQTGYPNSPAGDWGDQDSLPLTWEYFDIHNIRIRRLLAKNVMLVDEDLHWQATIPISGRMCWTVILGINNAFIYSYCIEVQIVDDVETLIWELYREHTHQLTSTTCDMMVGWILRWCILCMYVFMSVCIYM